MATEDKLIVIMLGSEKDYPSTSGMRSVLDDFEIPYRVRSLSAHKMTSSLLQAVESYEKSERKVVYIAVAGKSNGLGPVIAGNSVSPVINCPLIGDFTEDIFSSLRTPTSVSCSTILGGKNAALHAVQIFALSDLTIREQFRRYRKEIQDSLLESDRNLRDN